MSIEAGLNQISNTENQAEESETEILEKLRELYQERAELQLSLKELSMYKNESDTHKTNDPELKRDYLARLRKVNSALQPYTTNYKHLDKQIREELNIHE